MRLNQFIAVASGLSRRAADEVISAGRVKVNDQLAKLGQQITADDQVTFDGKHLQAPAQQTTIMFNKPVGYVCSRNGQGNPTIYDLLPAQFQRLKPVGRLDKDSSGLLLLTDDGNLANKLLHPRYVKQKIYEVVLDKPLLLTDKAKIEQGVEIDDYISRLKLADMHNGAWRVTMTQGRNRQIRRTFRALGYTINSLQRTAFDNYQLSELAPGHWRATENQSDNT